jgi:predicted Zn-dependent protease
MNHRLVSLLVWVLPLTVIPCFGAAYEALPKDEVEASRYTHDYLFMIDALIRNEKYERAKSELDALLVRVAQSSHESALARQAYGHLSIAQNDYAAAIEHFQAALTAETLPEQVILGLRYTLAQLFYMRDRFQEGLQQLQNWFAEVPQPSAESYVLAARFHYALAQWKQAVDALKQAIAKVDRPKEAWYQMLVGIYLEQHQYQKTIPVLQTMLKHFPDNTQYWEQLSNILLQLKRPRKAAATLALAAERDLLDEGALLRLAMLFLQQRMPYDAAELITKKLALGMIRETQESLSLLVDAWILAREPQNALKVLKKLTKIDQSGQSHLRSGRVLIEQEQWQQAASELKTGIRLAGQGVFEDWVLLGNAYYHLQKIDKARLAFESAQASATNDQQRDLASNWVVYLKRVDSRQ